MSRRGEDELTCFVCAFVPTAGVDPGRVVRRRTFGAIHHTWRRYYFYKSCVGPGNTS